MKKKQRLEIVRRMKDRGYTLTGWCRANGFPLRTVQDLIYYGTGLKRGGNRTQEILDALKRYGLLHGRRGQDPGRRKPHSDA